MKKKWSFYLLLPVACMLLSAFAMFPGGDRYEVFLDNELIIKEHVYGQRKDSPLPIDQHANATVTVSYSHCGVTGTSRTLSLRDESQRLIREWKFADVSPSIEDPMTIQVKEMVAAASGKSNISLYYQSKEVVKAVKIAPVQWVNKSTASK